MPVLKLRLVIFEGYSEDVRSLYGARVSQRTRNEPRNGVDVQKEMEIWLIRRLQRDTQPLELYFQRKHRTKSYFPSTNKSHKDQLLTTDHLTWAHTHINH
jgi:hypothetical protein